MHNEEEHVKVLLERTHVAQRTLQISMTVFLCPTIVVEMFVIFLNIITI